MKSINKKADPIRPSHRVYAVTKGGERNYWREIGAAWSHADGEGFSLKLDYLPLNDADIVVRTPMADEPEAEPKTGLKK